jgi:cytoskeleton protein RodZ
MPLDTGAVTEFDTSGIANDDAVRPTARYADAPNANHVGEVLRAIRESRGLSIEAIAETTRVRTGYLAAIEGLDTAALPSRPFAIGYVRAYAQALGLDADAVVSRYKAETPDTDGVLLSPVGVRHNTPRRFGLMAGVAVALGVALLGWNVARHAMTESHAPAPKSARVISVAQIKPQTEAPQIGAPLPPPPEANTPKTYYVPGMPGPGGAADSVKTVTGVADAPVKVQAAADIGGPFVAAGPVYGAPAPGGNVILQAKQSTSLVVRGAGGTVYFAKQLSPGEAWRAPALKGLVVEASTPSAVEAYVGGVSRGLLDTPQTALSKFGA